MTEAVRIYDSALNSEVNQGDALLAAHGLADTMLKWPDTRSDAAVEALTALPREAVPQRSRTSSNLNMRT